MFGGGPAKNVKFNVEMLILANIIRTRKGVDSILMLFITRQIAGFIHIGEFLASFLYFCVPVY